ncbi:MAG: hypothetical protein RQ760_18785 [Sedimentisphaerales bacterium]|nr:hypothetical protein [Sedimentisphaerales bacterium]
MGGLRKLRRRSRSRQYEVEPLLPQQSFHVRKMSEVILDFAEPLLNAIDDDDELFEEVIGFAVICWNASFLPEKEQKQIFCSMVDGMAKSDVLLRLSVQNDIRILLDRKKTFFADDKRMLIEFEVVKENGSRCLLAMSALIKD